MDFNQTLELAENIYFAVVEQLGIEDECIEPFLDGTKNTEKGEALYYLIEGMLTDGIFEDF
jgi:hypothetical protein